MKGVDITMNNKIITFLLPSILYVFPIHVLYIFFKNFLYDFKLIKPVKINSKVISIGNVSLGGTGKTPTTISIANFLQKKGFSVGIVSRGHGRRNGSESFLVDNQHWSICGDEVVLLKNNLVPEIHIFVSRNKIFAAKQLSKMGCDVILLDDAFQHRKIHRDIDIVLLGPENHFKSKQKIYPYGLLREPFKSIKRADITILTKNNMIDNKSGLFADHTLNLEVEDKILSTGNNKSIKDLLKNSKNLSLCSIGDPNTFSKTLKTLNINIKKQLVFADHWPFSKKDIDEINMLALENGLKNIVCTEKDYVKLLEFKNLLNIDINAIVLKHTLSNGIKNDILCRLA